MDVVVPLTGEVRAVQIFVVILGASSYTFAEATCIQGLPDWIGSHQRAFQFLGVVTELMVIDDLKSGVSKVCPYDPDINPTYQKMAAHYGTAVLSARVRNPCDKAKAEMGMQKGLLRQVSLYPGQASGVTCLGGLDWLSGLGLTAASRPAQSESPFPP
ncbi:hypothetical protein DFAR_3630020 [Desulfarculales bacterium]